MRGTNNQSFVTIMNARTTLLLHQGGARVAPEVTRGPHVGAGLTVAGGINEHTRKRNGLPLTPPSTREDKRCLLLMWQNKQLGITCYQTL